MTRRFFQTHVRVISQNSILNVQTVIHHQCQLSETKVRCPFVLVRIGCVGRQTSRNADVINSRAFAFSGAVRIGLGASSAFSDWTTVAGRPQHYLESVAFACDSVLSVRLAVKFKRMWHTIFATIIHFLLLTVEHTCEGCTI